jgi:hypothetical protein
MAKRDTDNQLAEAAVTTLQRQPTSHPAVHIPAIEEVLFAYKEAVAGDKNNSLPISEYNEIRSVAAARAGQKTDKSLGEIDRVLFNDYQLLRKDGQAVSVTTEVLAPRLTGSLVLREDRSRWRRLLAHQHVIAFPEVVELLELFAPPGKPASDAQIRQNNFIYWRKLNQVTVDYAVNELRDFGMLKPTEQGTFCADWAPPPALCMLIIKYYLALTGHLVDVAIETDELLSQVASVLPPRLLEHHPANSSWMRALRAPENAIVSEVGTSRMRITFEGLRWFAEVGLVSPLDCGKVLRQRRAKDALISLRDALIKRMTSLSPANMQLIEDALRPA